MQHDATSSSSWPPSSSPCEDFTSSPEKISARAEARPYFFFFLAAFFFAMDRSPPFVGDCAAIAPSQ
jgi:hypothetical protein